MHQGFSFLLDHIPVQHQVLSNHTGASRFCYNCLLGLIMENWEESREMMEAGEQVAIDDYFGCRQLDFQRL